MITHGMHELVGLSTSGTCLSCKHYLSCNDKSKSFSYSCSKFSRFNSKDLTKQMIAETRARVDPAMLLQAIEDPRGALASSFSISNIIDEAIKDSPMVASDIKVPDGDFPEAPNFCEWTTSDRFLKQTPYLEQVIIGTMVFADYCPRCSDMDYLLDTHKVGDTIAKFKRKVCLLQHGVCPSCKKNRKHFVDRNQLNFYNEMAVCAGQRSGKSALVAMMATYVLHRFIKLQNPNEVYGLLSSNVSHGTFVALTQTQAKDNLWDPILGNIQESPWFQGYNQMLMDHSSKGVDLVKIKDEFILYNNRRLVIYPAGPDKRVLRGRTRFAGSIDEVGWFDNVAHSTKIKVDAKEIYIALGNSLTTLKAKAEKLFARGFYNIPTAYFLNISSPSSVRDKIMELVRDSQGSRKMYGVLKPTWEMNPEIPREVLSEYFRKDPVGAMRDFGVQPPLVSSPFIANHEAVELCQSKKSNPLELRHVIHKSKARHGITTRYGRFDFLKESTKASALALDAGFANNSFACALGHLLEPRYPVIDLLVEVQTLPGIPINFAKVYTEIILPLINYRNVQITGADRWNSLKILHDIEEDTNTQAIQYSLKYKDMQVFKDHVLDGQIKFPKSEMPLVEVLKYVHSDYPACFKHKPVSHFLLQCCTVQDTGSQVIKGDQLTDDLLRASMLCTHLLLDEANAELFTADKDEPTIRPNIADFAAFRGASGGGGSTNGPGGQSTLNTGTSARGRLIGLFKPRADQ